MTTVFLVLRYIDYEGATVIAIATTIDKAKEIANSAANKWDEQTLHWKDDLTAGSTYGYYEIIEVPFNEYLGY